MKIEEVRDEIKEFAIAMEHEMAKNDGEKGDSWKDCDQIYMNEKLAEEFIEYFHAKGYDNLQIIQVIVAVMRGTASKERSTDVKKECSDIGNLAMMNYHRHRSDGWLQKSGGKA